MSTNKDKNELDKTLLKELGIDPEKPNEFEGKSTKDLEEENRRLDVALKQLELEDRVQTMAAKKKARDAKRAEYLAKTDEILKELARRAGRQRQCSHRKGGTSVRGQSMPLPYEGGDADTYALIKHQLPGGEWWILCQRCGAEWFPEDKFTGRPATVIGGFSWKDAMLARTDNAMSKSAVFVFEDNRSAEQKAADRWKPPVDENGNLVPDILALPPGQAGVLQPSAPVKATH
jgi:hypothetical protein